MTRPPIPDADVDGKLSLVCLPFAGAGAGLFRPWQRHPARNFEVVPVQLPGREELFAEAPYTTMAQAVEDVAGKVAAVGVGRRFALFGHSFGALLAYEVARHLVSSGRDLPERIFVSGSPVPTAPRPRLGIAALSDDEVVARVRELVGYDHEALHDADMREFLLPALRADMIISETYRPGSVRALPLPVTVLRGEDDNLVSRAASAQWRDLTTVHCDHIDFPGGHMYFTPDLRLLWDGIDDYLSESRR